MQFRNTLLALLLLLILTLVIYLTSPPPSNEQYQMLFPGINAGDIRAISLIQKNLQIELLLEGNHWWVVTNGRQLADATAVNEFLDRVTTARIYRRLTGVDPQVKEFGFQADQAGEYRLKVTGQSFSLKIGRGIPGRGGVYAQINGQVVITDPGLDTLIRKPLERLIRRNIFDWLSEDITQCVISNATGEIRLESDPEGNWWMIGASSKLRTSRRKVEDWLDTLLALESGKPWEGTDGDSIRDLYHVSLTTATDSQEIDLRISGSELLVFDLESGSQLIAGNASPAELQIRADDFRAVSVLDFNLYRLRKLEIDQSDSGSVTLTRWKDGWRTVDPQGGPGVLPGGAPDESLLILATLPVKQMLDPPLTAEIQSLRQQRGVTLTLEIPPRQELETLFIPLQNNSVVFHSQEPGAILLEDTDAVKLQRAILDLLDLTRKD